MHALTCNKQVVYLASTLPVAAQSHTGTCTVMLLHVDMFSFEQNPLSTDMHTLNEALFSIKYAVMFLYLVWLYFFASSVWFSFLCLK